MRFFFIFLCLSIQGFSAYVMTWGVPAVSLDSNPDVGDSDLQPSIAIDTTGNAVVVWGRTASNKASEDIWVTVYSQASRVWSGPIKISSGNAANAQVALDELGNALIVWEEGFPSQIMYRTLSASGVWSPSLDLPPSAIKSSTNAQTLPQIVMNRSGSALAIWIETTGSINQIYSAKKSFGSSWKSLGLISNSANNAELFLLSPLAINSSGDGYAVWKETDQIWEAQFVNGSWIKSVQVAMGDQPSVAIDIFGNGYFVWCQNQQIQTKKIVQGNFSSSTILSNPMFIASHPSIGVDESGNAIAVFEQYDRDQMHKFVTATSLPANETNWTAPVTISGPNPSQAEKAGFPRLVMNSVGDCAVIWKEQEEDHKLIVQGAGYSKGNWSSVRTLSSPEGNVGAPMPAYDLGIALNDFGNIIAVWPEDPSGNQTQHIKAVLGVGLAVTGTLPPAIEPENVSAGTGVAVQVLHRFPAHSDLFYTLKWVSTCEAAYYKIYRGSFSSLIGTSTQPYFEDHQRTFGKKETYLITSVDQHGNESSPITIIGYPKKK